jgi:hypothetical protein
VGCPGSASLRSPRSGPLRKALRAGLGPGAPPLRRLLFEASATAKVLGRMSLYSPAEELTFSLIHYNYTISSFLEALPSRSDGSRLSHEGTPDRATPAQLRRSTRTLRHTGRPGRQIEATHMHALPKALGQGRTAGFACPPRQAPRVPVVPRLCLRAFVFDQLEKSRTAHR